MASRPEKIPAQTRYPWDKWFAAGTIRLKRGKDYTCQTHAMAVQLRTRAARLKRRISVHIDEDKAEIIATIH